jgi:hypothetical protein
LRKKEGSYEKETKEDQKKFLTASYPRTVELAISLALALSLVAIIIHS